MARTQDEIRESICQKLHDAQHLLANASNEMTALSSVDGAFISLAKVNADNMATMVGNLETRIKYLAK